VMAPTPTARSSTHRFSQSYRLSEVNAAGRTLASLSLDRTRDGAQRSGSELPAGDTSEHSYQSSDSEFY